MALLVVAVDEQSDVSIDLDRWRELAANSLRSSDVDAGELNLIFVDEAAMTDLNLTHMGKQGPTDVLSFPLDGADGSGIGPALIGDVVVCPARADAQAAQHLGEAGHNGSVEDELALLIVHGVLHVLGHDHVDDTDAVRMQTREQHLLDAHHRT